ncbi:hypothetical protein HWV62_36077 [Athelia sp. TMB]|nr:hypothetical protein HWV62_36077 [Athelia sp. TMB]
MIAVAQAVQIMDHSNTIARSIKEEEDMDAADPLRHYFASTPGTRTPKRADDELLPSQPPTISRQTIQLSFDGPNGSAPISISLAVDASPGCGGIAWPAGQVLAKYLVDLGPSVVQDKKILEVGSGTGLVGLVAAALGARQVWITDQLPLLEIMRQNVTLNDLASNMGEIIPERILPVDIVLAADCVYYEPAFPLLVQTLSDLVTDAKTEVLFCYKKRRKV